MKRFNSIKIEGIGLERYEVMKKAREGKKSSKAKATLKGKGVKESKESSKAKMPAVTNYYLEELPKR